jgi:hypothetical protein
VSDQGGEPEEPAAEESVLSRTLDVLFFAPVGVALTIVEDLPGLIAKGRQRVETEISNARVVGKFVVDQGQREVVQRVDALLGHDHPAPGAAAAPDADEGPVVEPAPVAAPLPRPAPDPADGAVVEQALAGYDTLSASQVVRRLESLGPDELRAVHRHEASHRSRRTILNRTSQLLGDGGAAPASAE